MPPARESHWCHLGNENTYYYYQFSQEKSETISHEKGNYRAAWHFHMAMSCETHEKVLSPTFAHINSKDEMRQSQKER